MTTYLPCTGLAPATQGNRGQKTPGRVDTQLTRRKVPYCIYLHEGNMYSAWERNAGYDGSIPGIAGHQDAAATALRSAGAERPSPASADSPHESDRKGP